MNDNPSADPITVIDSILAEYGAQSVNAHGIIAALDQAGLAITPKENAEIMNFAIARATKSNIAQQWSPADALLFFLAKMQAGDYNPSELFIGWNTPEGGHTYVCATKGKYSALGLLEAVKIAFIRDNRI